MPRTPEDLMVELADGLQALRERVDDLESRVTGIELAPEVQGPLDPAEEETKPAAAPIPLVRPPAIPEPTWLRIARAELGVAERVGAAHNPRVLEYLSSVGVGFATDETAWCSAFVTWVMRQAGMRTAGVTAMARSWLRWGEVLTGPRLGCIVVLHRGGPKATTGHVGFWVGQDEGRALVLGGNQGGAPGGCVSIRPYPLARVLGWRWPS